jgi:sec-independent protein translocase protein TatA
MTTTSPLVAFGFPTIGPLELVVIAVLGLLIFGKRLPEVGRSLGKGIVQFKKGLRDVEDEVDSASREDSSKSLPPKDENQTAEAEAKPKASDHQPPGE